MKWVNIKWTKKPMEFFQDRDGNFSSSRLFSSILLAQYLYETRLVLRVDPTQYITFSATFVALILILVVKMGAENVASIIKAIKGKDESN